MTHKSCIKCDHYVRCKDPKRSIIYFCDRYKETSISILQEKAFLENALEMPIRTSTAMPFMPSMDESMFDVSAALEEMLEDKRIVSPDIKIPEGDFAEAPNFHTWCVSDMFLDQKPFIMQSLIGTKLFAEYCVAEGSLIITSEGIKRIEDVCSTTVGMHRYTSRIATSVGIEKASKSGLTSKSRNCLSIATYKKGRSVTVTPEHKLLILRDGVLQWSEAKNVRIGDFLTAKIGQNLWPKTSVALPKVKVSSESEADGRKVKTHVSRVPKKSSVELARFIGYCLSDGTIDGYRVGFINTCENLRNDFVNCGHSLFGIQFKTRSYTPKYGKQVCYTAGHASVSTSNVLAKLGLKLGVCYDKEIPDFILQAPKHEVVEFIKALFDCDGYMQRNRIGICMSSKKLVDSLSVMLDNLGIYHYREVRDLDSAKHPMIKNKKNRGGKDQHYVVEIRDIRKFCEIIGTNNTQRKEIHTYNRKYGQDASDLNTSLQHNIKPGSIPCFDAFVERLAEAKSEYHGLPIKQAVSSCQRSKAVALDRILTEDLFAYCTRYDCLEVYNELITLQKHAFAYYEVCTISDAGKHQVYDLTVPGSESFVCNGINVHNCPDCSDVDWMENEVRAKDSLDTFVRKVALLEHGKCPHCGKTRLHFFKKRSLAPYWELSLCAGQRCVVADTLILTHDGIVEIGSYANNRGYGFSDFVVPIANDKGLTNTSQFYRARAEYCKVVKTKLGFSVTGTNDHPLKTLVGFKPLSDIVVGDLVRIYYGQNVFGNKTVVLKDVTDQTDLVFSQYYASLDNIHKANVNRPRRKPGCGKDNIYSLTTDLAKVLGYWVAEGRHRGIANDDPEVLDLCFRVLHRMFGNLVTRGPRGVYFSSKYVQMWLQTFMKCDIAAKSAGKSVPAPILQGSKEVQCAFLSALFEGDGCVHRAKTKRRYSVGYASISKKLVNQLSVMLLNLGIPHRRRERPTWATNGSARQVSKTAYCLSISGPAIVDFATHIGFQSERKSRLLREAVTFFEHTRTNKVPSYYEQLPEALRFEFYAVFDDIQKMLNSLSSRGRKGCIGMESIYGNSDYRKHLKAGRRFSITKEQVVQYLQPILDAGYLLSEQLSARVQALLEFARSNYYYDSVVSNETTAEKYETYDVTVPDGHRFISNGLLSHNSGKSALFGMMASYLTHRMIKLERPNEVLGLLKANVLQGTFVALTFRQALDTLWEPFYGHLLEAPWFCNYHAMLDHVGSKTGEEIFRLKDTFVYYRHRRIQVYPAGPDKRVLRGRTRFVGGIDELGWFQNGAEAAKNIKMNANEVYIALERSLLTVRSKATTVVRGGFYNVPFGYFINISSPSSSRDKIMELVRKSQGSTRLMGLQLPTWKMNPHVPKSALAEEFRKDPEAAMRDYGAQPPLTNSPFISSHERVEACLSKKPHVLQIAYKTIRSRDKSTTEIYAELNKMRAIRKPSILALDAGYSNNSFAFAVGHIAPNGFPVISSVGEVIPSPGSRINHSLMYSNLLSEIAVECNIVLVCADRWNSLKVLADFEQEFETAKRQYSLKYADMQLFKSYIDDHQIMLPRPSKPIAEVLKYDYSQYPQCFKNLPADHLMLQLLTVQDTGSSVLKGDQLTDDILRAVMLCHRMLIDEANAELLSGPEEADVTPVFDLASTIVSRLYSGGGTGGGGGTGLSGGSSLGVIKSRN